MKRRIMVISLLLCLVICMLSGIVVSAEDLSKKDVYDKFCFDYGSGEGKAYPDNEDRLKEEIDLVQKSPGIFSDFGSPHILIYFLSGMNATYYDTAFENIKNVLEKVPYESLNYKEWAKEPYVSMEIAYQDVTKELLISLAENEWIDKVVVKHPEKVLPEDPPASETGDGAVYGVAVLGVAAAALTILLLRKKKI